MPIATFQKFYVVSLDLLLAKHNFESDDIRLYLTNTAPNAVTHKVKSDLAEITAGNGYAAGGVPLPIDAVTQANGVADVSLDEVTITITAVDGPIGQFQHVVCYNNTHATKPLISSFSYPLSITLLAGETFTLPLPASLFTGGL